MFFSCLDEEEQALSVLSSALQDWEPSWDARNFSVSMAAGVQASRRTTVSSSHYQGIVMMIVQWFSTLLMPRPFNTAVSVVMTANHIFFIATLLTEFCYC